MRNVIQLSIQNWDGFKGEFAASDVLVVHNAATKK
jgi:hypothetical protein